MAPHLVAVAVTLRGFLQQADTYQGVTQDAHPARAGLEFLSKVTRRRTVSFLVSDFLASGWQTPVRMASRRHDLVPVVIADPFEEELPKLGLVLFEDIEEGQLIEFDTQGPEAAAYREEVEVRQREREAAFRRLSLDSVHVRTDKPYVDALVTFFRRREKRMQH